jgi:CRP-like cAMP-binding protein
MKNDNSLYHPFRDFIRQYVSLNALEWRFMVSRLKIRTYQKGDIIHQMGDTCSEIRFIVSGLARIYMLDEHGKDYTWGICFNDENAEVVNRFVVDYDSFINQTPSHLSIEALEDCTLIVARHEDVAFVSKHSRKGEHFVNLMTQKAYSCLHYLSITRETKNARERFEEFVAKAPHLLDKVPQYHIATFLRITPQYLSQLKQAYLHIVE